MALLASTSVSSCHECVATLSLPLALFLVLAETAAGGIVTVAYLRASGGITDGFLKFATVTYAVLAGLALLVVWAGPPASYRTLFAINEGAAGGLAGLMSLLLLALIAQSVLAFRGQSHLGKGSAATITASALLLVGLGVTFWPAAGSTVGGVLLVLLFVISTVVLGAATTGMLLGHWYLVTPALTNRPLLRAIVILVAGLLLQAAVFPLALGGLRSSASPGQALGLSPVLTWLWVLGAVILPLLAAAPAIVTCRLRSFMSTTGLLYLAMIALLPGQLLGQLVFFVAAA
ncbi:MAG TPA: hypothetical protein VIT43_11990 [Candidatus Dormibacteraeota bacterium]